ncbi:MAG: AAA family ATPase, partial [Planctomycetota bacterium]
MKIRQLQIQGFKSFADRTRFEFGDGITVVVGPNGCGKSNIVDAIKWVLGDMSPRSLRSKRMEDVIFAGSRHRRPVGFSEVSLLLDNSDGQLHTERTDVEITRRLHRSGVSEYLLGGRPARLKDIRELFLDTGLGIEGNTIMEQGQIDALLAANPQDRRGLFEEAAGISRYKQRRKEAEQRLRRTQENLDRLLDVLELEEKRLRSLKNQAGRARRYQQLREELVRKRILRGVLRYREVAAERQRLQAEMEGALARERGVAADLEALRAARRKAEAERLEAREAVHAVQARVAQAVSDQRAAADRQTFGAKRRDALGARIEAARRECEEARAQAARRTEEIGGLEAEVEAASGEAEEHARCLADADAVRARLEAEAASIREAHRGAKRSALAALGRISEVRNARSERRVEIRQLEERIRRLGRQRADLVARRDRLETRLADLRARADRMEAAARLGAEALASPEAETAAARRAVEAARASRVALSEKRATQAARLDVLDRLAAAHEGVDQGAREILETLEGREPDEDGSRDGVHGILADLVSVRPEDAALLDRLLGPAAGALVVRTSDDALRWIRWLREHRGEARARFLALDLVRAGALPLPEVVGPLGCDEELAALVSSVAEGVALVDDLDEAIGRWRRGRVNAVTPRGERITASGALLGGRDGAALGLVGRTAERAGLRQAVDGMDRRVEGARREEQEAVSRLEEAEGRIAGRRRALAQRAEDRSRGSEALTGTERELGHVARTLAVLDGDIADLVDGLEFAHEAMAVVGRRLAAIEAERVRIEAEAAAVEERSVEIERALKGAGERRMEARLALAGSRARGEGARGRLARVREEVESLGARARVLAEELADLDRQRSEVEVEITEAEALARRADRERGAGGQARLEA